MKPQATFLTKLYSLLERQENHHMIRWDAAGEHIIVERPEQLAQHVLPSVYRQSRFASFSRQLNIYGFMRKVNLRNVNPAIDDPDASTWSHPTLNRRSPPDIVANFKRRVPPRLPKTRKRDIIDPTNLTPRSAVATSNPALPNSVLAHKGVVGRARGFSAPGSFNPGSHAGATSWGAVGYDRTSTTLPPLTVPEVPSQNVYGSQPPLSPQDSPPSHYSQPLPSYPTSASQLSASSYNAYPSEGNWSSHSQGAATNGGSHGISLLLNPSSGQSRPTPTINTSYSPFSAVNMSGEHSASSLSPDQSRPPTGYSSVSSMPYDDHLHDYSRPGSAHHRPSSPAFRPHASKNSYNTTSLRVGRARGHSHVGNPYPRVYAEQDRSSTSPPCADDVDHAGGTLPRARSLIHLPSMDPYNQLHSQGPQSSEYTSYGMEVGQGHHAGWNRVRSSTSTSSMSAASHASSSQAHTPESYTAPNDAGIHRYSPDYGYVPINEHMPQYTAKPLQANI